VEIPASPQRMVALTPSLVEIVFALGLGDRLAGATTWSDNPEAAKKIPRVGSYIAPDLETILALRPDLVLANREGNPPWVVERLESTGIPVFVTWPRDPAALPESLALLGRVCGNPEGGQDLARAMNRDMETVRRRLAGAKPVTTLLVIGSNPLVSAAPASYSGRLLDLAGARNVAPQDNTNWPRLSLEYVVQARPELVIVSTDRGQDLDREMEYWRTLPGLSHLPGYRVAFIESDLIDRPGPRLGLGLLTLARIVHPDLFSAGEGGK